MTGMPRARQNRYAAFLEAVADEVSPPLESVDFASLVDSLVAWSDRQDPPLEERTNESGTTIASVIPENDVLVWRVAPRMKDGAKIEVLPRSSTRLHPDVRQAFVEVLEVLSPGIDLDADRRFMIPLHNLREEGAMKRFLDLLDLALPAGRALAPDE